MTEDEGEHVLLGVVVVDTAEEGNEAAVTPGRTGDVSKARISGGVAHIGVSPVIGPVGRGVASAYALTETAVLQGVTDEGVEVVLLTQRKDIVNGVFPGPVPTGVGTLAHGIGVAEGLIGELVDEAVLTVGSGAEAIVELALPGEALDGLHAQVGRHAEAVVVALVVATGGINHFRDGVGDGGNQVPDTAVLEVVVLRVGAVVRVGGNQRVGGKHVEDIVPVVVAGADTALSGLGEGDVLTYADDVQVSLAPQHVVGVETGGDTGIVGSDGFAEDTFLVGVAHTHGELGILGTAHDVNGVVLVGSVHVADEIQPVGALEGTVLDAVVKGGIQDAGPVNGGLAHVEVHLVLDVHVLLGIQEFGHLLDVLYTIETVVSDRHIAGLALLGGNEDNTVGTTGTVNGAGCGVLEDVDALDVGGVQGADAAAGHAVDDVEGFIGTDGTHTADVHIVTRAGLAGFAHDAHTGGGGLHGAQGVGGVQFGEVVTLYLHRGAGNEFLLLGTVTHHHHFFQKLAVFLKHHVEDSLVSNRNHLSYVTDG